MQCRDLLSSEEVLTMAEACQDTAKALARELDQLSALKHGNIVRLYGEAVNEDDGELWAVMELVELGEAPLCPDDAMMCLVVPRHCYRSDVPAAVQGCASEI
jgi:serine/threonine protein kinase